MKTTLHVVIEIAKLKKIIKTSFVFIIIKKLLPFVYLSAKN